MSNNEIVYNSCYGRFSLSQEAIKRLCELKKVEFNKHRTFDHIVRHDPDLVATVKELGTKASGCRALLQVQAIKGDHYKIDACDGLEFIVEPEEILWHKVV